MDAALIALLDGDLVESPEHIGIALLAAVLREASLSSAILAVDPDGDQAAIDDLRRLAPKVVGLTLTTVNLPRAVEFGGRVRATLPDAHIVVGGPLATALGPSLLHLPGWEFADSLVRGEAEGMIAAFVEAAATGRPVAHLPGVCARGAPPSPVVARVEDLSALPWPARDQADQRRLPYLRLSTSRGCTSRCAFCDAPNAANRPKGAKPWRGRDPVDVVDEIESLVRRHGIDTFDFVDSTFEDPGGGHLGKQRVGAIAAEILRRGLRVYFNCCIQAQNWTGNDVGLIALLREAGLEKVMVGAEAGSQRNLDRYGKRASVADNLRAVGLFRAARVFVAQGFIMFDPYTEFADLDANADYLRRTVGYNLRRYLTRLELYPGTAILDQIRADGLLAAEYDATLRPYAYSFRDPRVGELATRLARLSGADYARSGRIGRPPPVVEFETFDIRTFTYYSRLERTMGHDPRHADAIAEGLAAVDSVRAGLAELAFGFFAEAVERARSGRPIATEALDHVDRRYAEAMGEIKAIGLRTGMRLRRAGAGAA